MGLLKYKTVYVMAPYHYASGGPELAHQLVDYLRDKGKEAYICYVRDCKVVTDKAEVTKEYTRYNIKISNEVVDISDNVLIIPETYLYFIPQFRNIKICVWWMSVDHAIERLGFDDSLHYSKSFFDKLRVIKHFRDYKGKYTIKDLKNEDYRLTHFYQATYIQQFLYGLGLNRVIRLTDYINPDILNNVDTSKNKEDIILYNPVKGIEYTSNVMKVLPGFKFVALKGFNREQLNDIFDRAKLYIDFGSFPGKDRLPREAAIHNCCIITGKFGASKYFEDVPIDSKYKFDMNHANYHEIKDCVEDVLQNYDSRINDFEYLRETIKHEQENFYREIDNIFI